MFGRLRQVTARIETAIIDGIAMAPVTTIDIRQVWENVLVDIELSVSKANFTTWFKGTHIVKIEDGVVFIGVPSQFYKDYLADKHHKDILRALRAALDDVRGIEYIIAKQDKNKEQDKRQATRTVTLGELPLAEHYVTRSDNLNPRYTFESFVVGPFNEIAHAAAQAVVNEPGITYNPLFIYGNTGYGKTHLIQAVGNQIKKLNASRKIFYVTSEKFSSDIVSAIQNNSVQSVKDKYRQYDVLIMDDVQFMSGKDKMQEELFHLFNTLYENNKQIVFSSDRHPLHIQNLADRLQSRFNQGMVVDISPPDHESRVAILKTKASHSNFILSDEAAIFLATAVEGNIRDLEGVLNRVICQTQVKGAQLDSGELHNLVKNNSKPQKNVSVKDVVRRVADFYDIDEEAIYEKTRRKEVVKPRQLIMYLMREDYNVSYPSIGDRLGGRDHTTVIHSCEKIKQELQHNTALMHEVEQIRAMLK